MASTVTKPHICICFSEGSEVRPPALLGPLCELLSSAKLNPQQHKLHAQQVVDCLK